MTCNRWTKHAKENIIRNGGSFINFIVNKFSPKSDKETVKSKELRTAEILQKIENSSNTPEFKVVRNFLSSISNDSDTVNAYANEKTLEKYIKNSDEALASLGKLLPLQESEELKKSILYFLGSLERNPLAFEIVKERYINDKNSRVREHAAGSLYPCGGEDEMDFIVSEFDKAKIPWMKFYLLSGMTDVSIKNIGQRARIFIKDFSNRDEFNYELFSEKISFAKKRIREWDDSQDKIRSS